MSVERFGAATAWEPSFRRLLLARRRPWLRVLIVLLALVAFFSIASDGAFFTVHNLLNIAADQAVICVMAVGATLILISAGVDLSVGGVLALSGIVGAKVMGDVTGGGGIALGILACLACGFALGSANGTLTVYLRIPPFIATLGTLGITLGLGYLLSGGVSIGGIPTSVTDAGAARLFDQIPLPVLAAAVVVIIAAVALDRTRFGRYVYAIGSNAEAAERAGINVRSRTWAIYALGGLAAGIASVIELSRFGSAAVAAHQSDALPVISAAVIGGTSLFGGVGTVGGTVIGAAIIGVLVNGLVILGVDPYWQQVATGVILLLAVWFDQHQKGAA